MSRGSGGERIAGLGLVIGVPAGVVAGTICGVLFGGVYAVIGVVVGAAAGLVVGLSRAAGPGATTHDVSFFSPPSVAYRRLDRGRRDEGSQHDEDTLPNSVRRGRDKERSR